MRSASPNRHTVNSPYEPGNFRGQSSVLSAQIDTVFASNLRTLKFPDELEDLFELEIGGYRLKQFSLFLIIGIITYNLFLITDKTLIKDVFQIALFTRLGIITPIALILLGLFSKGVSPRFRENSIAVLYVLTGISLIFLMSISHNENKVFYHPGLILSVTYCNLVVRLRFRYALISNIILFIIYLIFYPSLPTLPPQISTANIVVLLCCNVVTLYANYVIEREERISYLFSLRERIRQGELSNQNRKLSRLVILDPLTKLGNRREIDEYFLRLEENPRLNSLAVIMLDIDHFKKYNDTYGHPAGDECLRKVARELRKVVHRKGDVIGRIGGEEFLVLLPESEVEIAIKKAEEIRKSIFEMSIPHENSPVAPVITISAGVSAGRISRDSNPRQLLLDADEALYQAKINGRNQVSVIQP